MSALLLTFTYFQVLSLVVPSVDTSWNTPAVQLTLAILFSSVGILAFRSIWQLEVISLLFGSMRSTESEHEWPGNIVVGTAILLLCFLFVWAVQDFSDNISGTPLRESVTLAVSNGEILALLLNITNHITLASGITAICSGIMVLRYTIYPYEMGFRAASRRTLFRLLQRSNLESEEEMQRRCDQCAGQSFEIVDRDESFAVCCEYCGLCKIESLHPQDFRPIGESIPVEDDVGALNDKPT